MLLYRDSSAKRAEIGSSFVLASIYLVVLLAVVAVVIDLGRGFLKQRQIQFAADSGSMAGVQVFMDPATFPQGNATQQLAAKTAAVTRATNFAVANGLPAPTVIAGKWDSSARTFTSDSQVGFSPPYNAIRIPGETTIPTFFAGIFGVQILSPSSHAVSFSTAPSTSGCVKPFGVSTDAAFPSNPLNLSVPYTFTPALSLTIGWHGQGNWGKLDIEGSDGQPINMSSGGNFFNYMASGVCGSTSGLGENPNAGPGNASFCSALTQPAVLNQDIYMFLTNPFPNGSHPTVLQRYLLGAITGCSGTGSNVQVTLTIKGIVSSLPGGGNAIPGSRSLVM